MKNKKSQIFVFAIFIMSIIVLTAAYIQLSLKYDLRTNDGIKKKVGDLQFELIDKYAEGEAYLFYLDQSAKYSLDLSLFHLAEKGGHYVILGENGIFSTNDCGDYNGYQIWTTPEKECYPTNYEENFEYYFDDYFSEYMFQFDIEDPYFDIDFVYDEEGILSILGLKNEKTISIYREGQEPEKEPDTKIEIPEGLMWPVKGYTTIVSCYGWRDLNGKDCHDGIDISALAGTYVYAIEDGKVIDERTAPGGGLGNSIAIEHSSNFYSAYSHLTTKYVHIKDVVKKGDLIGTVGSTGGDYEPHLDLKLYTKEYLIYQRDKADIDPLCVFPQTYFNIREGTSGYKYGACTCGAKCN